jgi:hypothetical protein
MFRAETKERNNFYSYIDLRAPSPRKEKKKKKKKEEEKSLGLPVSNHIKY